MSWSTVWVRILTVYIPIWCMHELVLLDVCVRVCVDIGCSQRSGLMSTGCCYTPLPLLINWLVVDVFGALSSYPEPFSLPLFWQLPFNHFFVEHGECTSPGTVITTAILDSSPPPTGSFAPPFFLLFLLISSFCCCFYGKMCLSCEYSSVLFSDLNYFHVFMLSCSVARWGVDR